MNNQKLIKICLSNGKVLYEPQPKQKLLHLSEAEETLFGGAAGGGKTESLLWDAYLNARSLPGGNFLFLRRLKQDLYSSIIMRSKLKWTEEMGKFNETRYFWKINTDVPGVYSYIWFGHINTIDTLAEYQSKEYDGIYFDELTHFEEEMYVYMKTRLRTVHKGFKPFMKSATNPGGIGHKWVRDRFRILDRDLHYRIFQPEPEENPLTGKVMLPGPRMFIPSFLTDNRKLMEADPQYATRLAEQNPITAKQLLLGDWSGFSGQALGDFSEIKHVIKPFEIPTEWKRFRAIDYGYTQPMCCLWFTIDPKYKTVYCYRELYGSKMTDEQQARAIVAMSKYPSGANEDFSGSFTVGDPSMWSERGQKTQSGLIHSVARVYAENGVFMAKAVNARQQGFMRVNEYLGMNPLTKKPFLQIFNTCKNLIRTLPLLMISPDNPEDVNTKQEDHAYDALRYFLMTKPIVENIEEKSKFIGKSSAVIKEYKEIERMRAKLISSEEDCYEVLNNMG